jgi:hypothetical protein
MHDAVSQMHVTDVQSPLLRLYNDGTQIVNGDHAERAGFALPLNGRDHLSRGQTLEKRYGLFNGRAPDIPGRSRIAP